MKSAILLAVYGAGTPKGRDGIRYFENSCRENFPDLSLRWAYTSLKLREKIALEKQKSDSVSKALMRLYYEKFDAVAIQPLQAISGREYEDVRASAERITEETKIKIVLGKALLDGTDKLEKVANALLEALPQERKASENVVFMGHGAKHPAMQQYESLAEIMTGLDKGIFLGTLSGERRLDKILPKLSSTRVWLIPLLSLVGSHAMRDMAGDQPDSWKSRINAQKHECVPVLKGLSECQPVARIWMENLSEALESLDKS